MTGPAWCTQDVGFAADCGDPAAACRDGFPLCAAHAARWDALTALAAREES